MNLIHDSWIPVRRRNGDRELIAPWQITDQHNINPIVAISAPRADFTGALAQFLIGLLQTTMPPESEVDWEDFFYVPPEPALLKESFSRYQHAFEVDGEGSRFMQDIKLLQEGDERAIGSLLIETPGDNTLQENRDLFIKRGMIRQVCPSCAATALYTMQINAPEGGRGYFTSLRGGGPLTTLILSDPREGDERQSDGLWGNLWLNVLNNNHFLHTCGNPTKDSDTNIFPWLISAQASTKVLTPQDAYPAQMFWGMSRRIFLDFGNATEGFCDICGITTSRLLFRYLTKPSGINYKGPWRHPLSPHNIDKQGFPSPVHPQPGGIIYRHWLGLVQRDEDSRREPAKVVQIFHKYRYYRISGQFRLWAFGYDMKSNKARCWYESIMPLYQMEAEIRIEFEGIVATLVMVATEIAKNVRAGLKNAWFDKEEQKKKEKALKDGTFTFIENIFWQNTEPEFYSTLVQLIRSLEKDDENISIRKIWHSFLCDQALLLFDRWALSGPIEDADPKRIAKARHELRGFNRSRKIIELLGLPKQEKCQTKSSVLADLGEEVHG